MTATHYSTGDVPGAIFMSGIAKAFGPVVANRDASLEVSPGEIHALVGENGAGKSTLMRILSGMFSPDAGIVRVGGRDVTGWSTAQAIDAGVGMVHQHFMLVPTLTVAENVVLGREPRRGAGALWSIDTAAAERDVRRLSERTGLAVAAERRVSELSVGEAQRVEILKTLFRGARTLILDEPTAVLSPPEVEELWSVLRGLREAGGTIVLITHKLDEVMTISDAITVMRAGTTVDRLRTSETTPAAIARAMVGRDVALAGLSDAFGGAVSAGSSARDASMSAGETEEERRTTPSSEHTPLWGGPPTGKMGRPAAPTPTFSSHPPSPERSGLLVRDLVVPGPQRPRAVDGVSFTIAPGEILGIAGVEGNGQTELIEAIAGLRAPLSGSVKLGGRELLGLGVKERADAGLAHVPEDRHRRGLVLDYSVSENLILGQQHHFTSGPTLDRARIAEHARQQIEEFDIRPSDPALPARALSGGNQQKIVIAREMGRDFLVLLAAQPTRGVDVGAIEFIHARLREARGERKAVLLVSAELNEILALADRVAVMYGGRIVAVMPRADASPETLGPYMTGAHRESAA